MVAQLDPTLWNRPDFDALAKALDAGRGETRLVGGAVRDMLSGKTAQDIDIATRYRPETVMERLEAADIKTVPTGIAHGTVTAVLRSGPVEITTLRRDVSTDGRRATIAYTDDWQEDAARRDFTINALSADLTNGTIYDYFGGIADLTAGLVRFIGDPLIRIAEDHLRILRFFRFQARFGSSAPDAASLGACAARANDLMALSRERIADELQKLLALPEPASIFALMMEHGIWKPVLPEIEGDAPEKLSALADHERRNGLKGEPIRRLAALFPAEPSVLTAIATQLKLSSAKRKRLELAAGRQAEDSVDPRALAYRLGREAAIDRLLLLGSDVAQIRNWTPPAFPLTGGAIVARGVKAGPDVARLLRAVEDQWVAEGFPDASRTNDIADQFVRESIKQT